MNIVLQDDTVQTVRRAAKPGERSRFINTAVQYYAATHSPNALRAQLRQTAIRDRDLGDEVRRDWYAVDREPWPTGITTGRSPKRRPIQSGAKSSL